VAVHGDLCFWRVYEISRDFARRPVDGGGDRMFSVPLGTNGSDSLAGAVGAFPARVRQALLEHRTRGMYLLNRLTGAYRDMPAGQLEEEIAALEGQWNLDDLKIGNGLHLTLEMRRTVSLLVHAGPRYLWDDEGRSRLATSVAGQSAAAEPTCGCRPTNVPPCGGQGRANDA
jgi:hypothetical protein